MTTKIIYFTCLGYNRRGAILKKIEKDIKTLKYKGKKVDLMDFTKSTAYMPFVEITLDGVKWLELPERLPKIDFAA